MHPPVLPFLKLTKLKNSQNGEQVKNQTKERNKTYSLLYMYVLAVLYKYKINIWAYVHTYACLDIWFLSFNLETAMTSSLL